MQHKIKRGVQMAVAACRAKETSQSNPISVMVTTLIDNRYSLAVVLAASHPIAAAAAIVVAWLQG